MTPDTGKVGTTVVLAITSTGFSLDGPYQVLWSKSPISDEGNYMLVAEGEVAKGSMQTTAIFTVTEAAYGTNYVQFRRGWRPTDNPYNFTFNIVPDIEVTPSSALVGLEVTIQGTGFPANKNGIKLNFDSNDIELNISTGDKGSFTAQFTIPETIAGKHEFKATMENRALGDVSASIQVKPKIILEPENPEIGGEVTLTGMGFAANSQLSIKYDDISIPNSPPDKELTTDTNGNFSHKFNLPESSKTDHVITATDKAGNVATFGLGLEGEPPPAPNIIYPCNGQRFGWFGPQLVNFKWEPVSDTSGVTYTIDVGPNTNVWPPIITKTGLTSTTCTLRLDPGTYFWRVKAIDGAGNESETTLAPYPIKVALFSTWITVGLLLLFAIIFVLIVRAFFRRLREYF